MKLLDSLAASEIEIRKPVWLAFSDLYLDTDVTDSYEYIAKICAESPFTLEKLRHILCCEVAPVLSPNLLAVAGAWSGFDENWLFNEILKLEVNSLRGRFYWKVMKFFGFHNYTLKHWSNIHPLIERARNNS